MVMANTPVRNFNLVVPLAENATDMRTTETAGLVAHDRSGAVSRLTDCNSRLGDVDSTNKRSTPLILTMPGIRTSTMAVSTTTSRATSSELLPSADCQFSHLSIQEVIQ